MIVDICLYLPFSYVCFKHHLCDISHWGGKGEQSATPDSEKFAKNREKIRKNREETAKIGKFLSLCPS